MAFLEQKKVATKRVSLPQREKYLKPAPADASPWLFETASGRWNRLRTGTTAPKSGYGDTLIYLSSRKQAFFAHREEATSTATCQASRRSIDKWIFVVSVLRANLREHWGGFQNAI